MKFKSIALFFAILALAATFRLIGLNWDQNTHLHPDERFLTMVATNMQWPENIAQYLDTSKSLLNPNNIGFNFYVYGTWPVILTKAVAQAVHRDFYDGIHIVGRVLAALADLSTAIFVFLITKRILKNNGGTKQQTYAPYLAMFLYAVMVTPIQLSHFFAVDPYAVLCLTISIYCIIHKRLGAILGLFVGLAVGAKISSLLILPIIVLAYISQWPHKKRKLIREALLFGVMFLITLRMSYPYLFDGVWLNQQTLDSFTQLKAFDGNDTTFPPALQWIGTIPLLFPFQNMIMWGLGLPLGVLVCVAIGWITHNIISQWKKHIHDTKDTLWFTLILLVYVFIIFAYQGMQFAKAMRYFYSIYPILAVLSGLFITSIYHQLHSHVSRFRYLITPLFGIVLLLYPLGFVSIYLRPNTRIAASNWIYANIPASSRLAWEHWDDPIPLGIGGNSIGQYVTFQLPMYDPDTDKKWIDLTDKLSRTDYIILSSNRVYGSVAHIPRRYPQTNRYYRLLFSETLGFTKVAEFTSRPQLFGIELHDDNADETFTVYDHPKVLIFKNTQYLPATALFDLIYDR